MSEENQILDAGSVPRLVQEPFIVDQWRVAGWLGNTKIVCPECGYRASITTSMKIRRHNPMGYKYAKTTCKMSGVAVILPNTD